MRSMRSVERALAKARQRGRTRASIPVATLQELLSLAGPALERQAQYERAGNRLADQIRRALAR
jgi:hypothetical protein